MWRVCRFLRCGREAAAPRRTGLKMLGTIVSWDAVRFFGTVLPDAVPADAPSATWIVHGTDVVWERRAETHRSVRTPLRVRFVPAFNLLSWNDAPVVKCTEVECETGGPGLPAGPIRTQWGVAYDASLMRPTDRDADCTFYGSVLRCHGASGFIEILDEGALQNQTVFFHANDVRSALVSPGMLVTFTLEPSPSPRFSAQAVARRIVVEGRRRGAFAGVGRDPVACVK